MSMYCTPDQARDAGATGSTAELTAAIERASDRVTRYTREMFVPTPLTLVRTIGRDGNILTHTRIQAVTAVRYLGWSTPIAAESWRFTTSETPGQLDMITLAGTLAWADATVLGAEPWNGGWANLMYGRYDEPSVEIDGTFGWDAPPADVAEATARIAAALRRGDKTPEGSSESTSDVDEEGNVIPVVPPFQSSAASDVASFVRTRARTTGSKAADDLLAPYVREPVMIGA